MDNSLLARLSSLSEKERHLFYRRLTEVLNDKYSCFIYGGMNNQDYANIPKDKLERLETNLYNNMFEKVAPPLRVLIDTTRPKEKLEKLTSNFYLNSFNEIIFPRKKVFCCKVLRN